MATKTCNKMTNSFKPGMSNKYQVRNYLFNDYLVQFLVSFVFHKYRIKIVGEFLYIVNLFFFFFFCYKIWTNWFQRNKMSVIWWKSCWTIQISKVLLGHMRSSENLITKLICKYIKFQCQIKLKVVRKINICLIKQSLLVLVH